MTSKKLPWLIIGGLAVGGAAASLTTRLQAQTRDDAVHVCAGTDGVLRVATSPSCAPDQTSLYLATAGPLTPKDDKKPDDASAALQKRIADLEKRVAELEEMANKGELGNRVTAPFVVTDETGRPIFEVVRDSARLYNTSRKVVAAMAAAQDGGVLMGRTSDGTAAAYLGAVSGFTGLEVKVDNKARVDLGEMPTKRAGLMVMNAAGEMLAAIGEGTQNEGLAAVLDSQGNYKAELMVTPDNKGELLILGRPHVGVAALTEGSYGGNLSIWDVAGTGMVDAGVTVDGVGVVRTGPDFFKPGMGVLGLPGSYIIGKK